MEFRFPFQATEGTYVIFTYHGGSGLPASAKAYATLSYATTEPASGAFGFVPANSAAEVVVSRTLEGVYSARLEVGLGDAVTLGDSAAAAAPQQMCFGPWPDYSIPCPQGQSPVKGNDGKLKCE